MHTAVAAALILGVATGPGTPVPADSFGMHAAGISRGQPAGMGPVAIRLWDSGVRWDQVELSQNSYSWGALDAAVANAEAAGARDILYVLGSTPRWAARNPDLPGLYGPGTTSLPRDFGDYVDYAREVAKRFKGRITSYQIWNEANTRSFYEGDWVALARLTRRTYNAVKAIDPQAQVVAASSTVIPGPLFQNESFFVRHARALKRVGEPVDAMAVHLYPVDTSKGPDARTRSIRAAQKVLNKVGISKPLWDTEVNYGDRRAGLPQVVPDPVTATTYVARTYIDSATLGIGRTYWYGWDLSVLGIDLNNEAGPTPAGRGFRTVRSWLTAATPQGCRESRGVRRCYFGSAEGKPFTIVWATGAPTTVDAGGMQVCRLDGSCERGSAELAVDAQPVLLRN